MFRRLYNALKSGRYRLEKSCTNGNNKEFDDIINCVIESSTKKNEYFLKAFTDNIVIGFPENNNNHMRFQEIISKLARFQFKMIEKDFFIRGAISYDDAYIDDYEGESIEAINPRIILTKSAVNAIDRYIDRHPNLTSSDKIPSSWIKRNLLEDSDGKWFINYLNAAFLDFFDYNREPNLEIILKHKELVENNLEKHKENNRVWLKYVWVAHYHNFFCNLHPEYFSEKHKITITYNSYDFKKISLSNEITLKEE
ncbi:hypothetical protein [Methylobacter sp.]|uniref:hypothetical protein n=1 Tax=Methylobacter sp. TaxID=2051955 RepID=UPI002488E01C|nr:hypothetical protein [Methylobacter sp.]MDI1279284.1 hypothetical protein [Methylobacter sp.]MDI1360051.1 hypothetical protein [Methylobacter sp.]